MCLQVRDGEEQDVYKEPVTDLGKASKRGRLALVKQDGVFTTVRREALTEGQEDELVTVFRDGKLVQDWDWDEVRARQQGAEEKR
jgi:nicotinamide phosphoribosyltransferase